MKTLYLSDLDGTLFTPDARISDFTAESINRLVENGLHFSIATARTAVTVRKLLAPLHLKLPVILMNGVCLYDLAASRAVYTETIPAPALHALLDAVHAYGAGGFLYVQSANGVDAFYERVDSPQAAAFMNERRDVYGKKFYQIADLHACSDRDALYFSYTGPEEKLRPLEEAARGIAGIRVEFYQNVYHPQSYFMEVCSAAASKRSAAQRLRALYGFDELVGFGDNLNDLPLFEACDRCYAVQNARDAVKARAAGIIGANTDDGVVRFLLREAAALPS